MVLSVARLGIFLLFYQIRQVKNGFWATCEFGCFFVPFG